MSAHMLANQDRYMRLAQQFVAGKFGGRAFERRFLRMRHQDMEADDALQSSWPKPYDMELIQAHAQGALTEDEFDKKWQEMFGYSLLHNPVLAFFHAIFMDIEDYEPNRRVYEAIDKAHPGIYYHDEQELRRRIQRHLQELSGAA